MPRERLPDRHATENFDFIWNRIPFTASISRYPDGRLGEIFLASNKAGSHLDATARDAAVVCSIALQFGTPIAIIRGALLRAANGEAETPLGAALDHITE
jgi:hypothetical protein